MKKSATVYTVVGICILIFIGYFVIKELQDTKQDPISGLYFQIPERLLSNKDFSLVVTKQSLADMQQLEKQIEDFPNSSPVYVRKSKKMTNSNGISYEHVTYEECYFNHTVSLDEKANIGKELITCSDTYGSEQDRYYVYSGNDVYLFTTPFPTRIVYHDPYFAPLPQRINDTDFENIIKSLKR